MTGKLWLGMLLVAGTVCAEADGMGEKRGLSPNRTITFCRDKQSLSPNSAPNDFSPISEEFLHKIGKPYTGTIAEARQYKVTLLEQPKHGKVRLVYEPSRHWTYVPTEGYTGTDRATYLVESQGKRYKVVINFWVVEVIDPNSDVQECESMSNEGRVMRDRPRLRGGATATSLQKSASGEPQP